MLRAALAKRDPEIVDGFRLRGREVSRIEGFSDAVFGFALTLLVVSLDVPKTFAELVHTMLGFPAFALCFLFLALIWNAHYKFCRRYGLDDGVTRFRTCLMLFVVLFYVYPLKFLFNFGFNGLFTPAPAGDIVMTRSQLAILMVIYGIGFAAVYLSLIFLQMHAWRLRDALELSALERFDTRYQFTRWSILVAIGLVAAGIALLPWGWRWSGGTYLLLFPLLRAVRILHRRKRRQLFAERMDAA
jgi:uncharacterized membrane protein